MSFDPAAVAREPEPELAPDVEWRRLDRRMLLIHPVREFMRYLPAFIGFMIAGSTTTDGEPWWFGLIAVVGAVGLGLLKWATTRYRFTPDQVQLQTGWVNRKVTTTPTDRVRTVDVTASPMHRVLKLAEVSIGTGADSSDLTLDGLTAEHANALREDLIHRRRRAATTAGPESDPAFSAAWPSDLNDPPIETEDEIVRLDPRWIRFALYTSKGFWGAAAIVGVGWQVFERASGGIDIGNRAEAAYERLGLLTLVALVVVVAIVVVLLLSVIGYVLTYWNFRLTRHRGGGTLRVERGLFTTRATTIEEERLRGVSMSEPLSMRAASGASLDAITTGLDGDGQSAQLLPPAPTSVARAVADEVLDVPGVLAVPLQAHGPAATRRRWTRAFTSGLFFAAAVVALTFWWQPWLGLVGLVPLAAAPWLARDRARSLGHALTERYLVARSGSVVRKTEVVERRGVVAVALQRSFFQRRAGLTTVMVATAAGDEVYEVLDAPDQRSVDLLAALLPGHVEPLLQPKTLVE